MRRRYVGDTRTCRTYAVVVSHVRVESLRELVEAHRDEIKAIVARHHGRSVAIFGSAARGDDQPGSDIDFLVELEPGTRPFELLLLGADLEEALGVRVDVGTPSQLRDGLRAEVLAEALPL
jgi:predicted nucleotidyltransferase